MINFRKFRALCAFMVIFPISAFSMSGFAAGLAEEETHSSASQTQSAQHEAQDAIKGPHGGKLLREGNTLLELAIFEGDVPPEYRAWIEQDGQAVRNANLIVSLTRLGGKEDRFEFINTGAYWLGQGTVTEPHSFDVAVRLTIDAETYHWQWPSYEGRVAIDAETAKKFRIQSKAVSQGSIEKQVQSYGRLVTPADRTVQVRARFPGLINAVNFNLGDQVKKGETLALIESNESLKSYVVRAPIDAIVQERNANAGETTTDKPLFTLTNNDILWAEFKIFPNQRDAVKVNQVVQITHGGHVHESKIFNITPASPNEPYVLARAALENVYMDMAPGDLVSGEIAIERVAATLMVENRALHSFRNWTVVFVQVGNEYEIRPLALGATDGQLTEVLAGLNVGDQYVVENSYLIKADILKSGASHDH